mgnify:CR=1 FL=1
MLAGVVSGILAVKYNEPTFAFVGAWALTAISKFQAPESLTKTISPKLYSSLKKFAAFTAGTLGCVGCNISNL